MRDVKTLLIRFLVLGFFLSCAFLRLGAAGPLFWTQSTLALTPKSTDRAAVANFDFQSVGSDSVVIDQVHPDCTCVTAPLEKTTYAPGERGQIAASFVIGRQTGDHAVTIQVKGHAGEQPFSTVLVLHIKIVDVVVFSPRFLYWKAEEPLDPKTVEVTLLAGEPIALRDVRAGNPAFTVKLTPTDDPRRFTLLVTPPPQRARSICPITVTTESTDHPETHEHGMVARLL